MILKFFKWLMLIIGVINVAFTGWAYLTGITSRFYWTANAFYLLIAFLLFKWDAKRTAKKKQQSKTKTAR
ncbi:hypothetical protein [Brevibacillus fortis]|uniref:Uncharacterized protein n=1 Tax=Brevibacillus fortis TaxID=2126352 RepID=A0A2P7UVT2_9BACL|nr:hypothetical protein [Brevibacillus fortis]PSJ91076.1 hypothetical protein C7R93_20725 [Brevibacillus fortis]